MYHNKLAVVAKNFVLFVCRLTASDGAADNEDNLQTKWRYIVKRADVCL